MRAFALLGSGLAAALLPGHRLGVGVVIVALLVAAAIATRAQASFDLFCFGGLALALACIPALLDATWVVVVDLALAVALAACAVAGPRVLALLAPVRALRGAPELMPSAPDTAAPVLRGTALGVVVLAPFTVLFWTADAAFAELGRQAPVPSAATVPERGLLFVLVLGLTVGLALAAQRSIASPSLPRSRLSLGEWAIPLVLLDVLFLAFVAVQVTVLFGGRDHVLETTGLTYAEYARQGFWQLITASVLTVVVIGAATRLAETRNRGQKRLLAALLGSLCILTIVTVASTLHRLGLYEDAFGLTRLRLAAETAAWALGALFVLLLVAGVVGAVRAQLPRMALAGAAVVLVAFSISNPDGRIAERNIERWRATGDLDVAYLQGLSADAVPALVELPEPLRTSVTARSVGRLHHEDTWSSANLSRIRARSALSD